MEKEPRPSGPLRRRLSRYLKPLKEGTLLGPVATARHYQHYQHYGPGAKVAGGPKAAQPGDGYDEARGSRVANSCSFRNRSHGRQARVSSRAAWCGGTISTGQRACAAQ